MSGFVISQFQFVECLQAVLFGSCQFRFLTLRLYVNTRRFSFVSGPIQVPNTPFFSGEMSPVNVFCYLRLFYKTIINVDHSTWCHKWSFVKPSTSSWQEGHVLRENFPGGWSSYPETWQTCCSQRNNTPPVSICLVAHEKNMFKRKIIKTHYQALHAQTTRV